MLRGDESSPVYPGEIRDAGDWRLIVSPRGGSYAVQRDTVGPWATVARFGTATALRDWLAAQAAAVPQSLSDAAATLPDQPCDCWWVPFPSKARRAAVPVADPRPPLPHHLTVKLPDGRLACQVAAARGVSRDLLAERLATGATVEQAVFDPVPRKRAPAKVARPSLLREVRLSDGRLAWPVAQANGISEVTFRARLKSGRSPDDAAQMPITPNKGRLLPKGGGEPAPESLGRPADGH